MLLVGQDIAEPPNAPAYRQDRARRLTEGLVTRPANSNVRPKARTIGHAVGAGISTVFVWSLAVATSSMVILLSIQRPIT